MPRIAKIHAAADNATGIACRRRPRGGPVVASATDPVVTCPACLTALEGERIAALLAAGVMNPWAPAWQNWTPAA